MTQTDDVDTDKIPEKEVVNFFPFSPEARVMVLEHQYVSVLIRNEKYTLYFYPAIQENKTASQSDVIKMCVRKRFIRNVIGFSNPKIL